MHTRAARLRPGFVLPLLVLATGCPDKKPAASVSLEEFLNRLTAAVCNYYVACDATPDLASCVTTFEDPAELALIEATFASGKSRYDAAKAGTCIEWYERYFSPTTGCTQSGLAAVGTEDVEEACIGWFVGTVPAGGACSTFLECTDPGFCQPTDAACAQQCCPATCVARPAPLPVGSDCSTLQPNQSCAVGSFCLTPASGGPPTCVVPSTTEGGACSGYYQCASPLFCDMEAGATAGTCRRLAATGAACSLSVSAYLTCDDSRDFCDPTTKTCVRRKAVGASCDPTRSECIYYAVCQLNVCTAYPKQGEACTPGVAPRCLGSLECSTQTNTCDFPAPDGSCP